MTNPAIATLEPGLRGRLIRPADSDYDNGMIDKRPRLIARCVDVAMWCSITSSGSDFTKSPFQYHWTLFGRSGSKSACMAGNGNGGHPVDVQFHDEDESEDRSARILSSTTGPLVCAQTNYPSPTSQ